MSVGLEGCAGAEYNREGSLSNSEGFLVHLPDNVSIYDAEGTSKDVGDSHV